MNAVDRVVHRAGTGTLTGGERAGCGARAYRASAEGPLRGLGSALTLA
jgi:hypothetical protein